jgi:coenzyme F420-reducing hydrogenase beta subunit
MSEKDNLTASISGEVEAAEHIKHKKNAGNVEHKVMLQQGTAFKNSRPELYSPQDIVKSGLCIGCGSCAAQAQLQGTEASMKFNAYGLYKPKGPSGWYKKPSARFSNTCPFSPKAQKEDELAVRSFPEAPQHSDTVGRFQTAFVGHVLESDFRLQGSSGGMVTWVASELLRKGLIDGVAHVVAVKDPQSDGRFFKYRISRNQEELNEGAKSRYYPVELSDMLRTIKETPGRYAVVALPCMIKAVQLLRKEDAVFQERISFTLGLFCGHMKSAHFAESFAWQMNVPFQQVKEVEYRYKYPDRPANWYNAMLRLEDGQQVNKDWWHLADGDWGAGFFMSNACNFCDDVVSETADVAFGDAWVEPYSSDGKGTNVVVARSALVSGLIVDAIQDGRLQLEEVDGAFVEQTQAAGFRQRREGLAYRLTWAPKGVQPEKRVKPDANRPEQSRKVIYRSRYWISKWSHRMFWLARKTGLPGIYLSWARYAASFYHGIAYHKGNFGEMKKRYLEFKK